MQFNDTAAVIAPAGGPPPWLATLADDATLEATVLKRPIEGKANILALIRHAIPLYEFQHFTYKGDLGDGFFLESYRSQIRGVPIECLVVAHTNADGKTDSLVINHRPLNAALLFSKLMWEQVGDEFKALYLSGPEAAAIESVSGPLA